MATVATTCAVRRNLQNRRHRSMVRERSFRPLMDTACPSQWPMYPDTGNTYGYSEGISLSLPEIALPENGCVNQQVKCRETARHRCIIRAFFDDNGKLRPLCLKMLEQAPCDNCCLFLAVSHSSLVCPDSVDNQSAISRISIPSQLYLRCLIPVIAISGQASKIKSGAPNFSCVMEWLMLL